LMVWVLPFVVAMLIFPLRASERPLFESIMPVALTASVVLFASLYFKGVEGKHVKEGAMLGVLWLAISIAIDLAMFMQGPMSMPFVDYVKDIGLTYLVIPAITVGFGYALESRK